MRRSIHRRRLEIIPLPSGPAEFKGGRRQVWRLKSLPPSWSLASGSHANRKERQRDAYRLRGSPLVWLATSLLLASPAAAGPPYITDDPEPTEYLHWENIIFSQGTRITEETGGVAPYCDCNYGILPNFQLHVQSGMAFSRARGVPLQWGVGDTEFGLKYRFVEQDKNGWTPSVAFYPLLEAPTGDAARGLGGGRARVFLPLWVQKDFGDWTTFGGGGYWINPGPGNKNYWFVGWVLQRKITDKLALGVELYHQTPDEIGGMQSTAFNVGGTYDFTDHYHLLFW
jgi:hypothetical protein